MSASAQQISALAQDIKEAINKLMADFEIESCRTGSVKIIPHLPTATRNAFEACQQFAYEMLAIQQSLIIDTVSIEAFPESEYQCKMLIELITKKANLKRVVFSPYHKVPQPLGWDYISDDQLKSIFQAIINNPKIQELDFSWSTAFSGIKEEQVGFLVDFFMGIKHPLTITFDGCEIPKNFNENNFLKIFMAILGNRNIVKIRSSEKEWPESYQAHFLRVYLVMNATTDFVAYGTITSDLPFSKLPFPLGAACRTVIEDLRAVNLKRLASIGIKPSVSPAHPLVSTPSLSGEIKAVQEKKESVEQNIVTASAPKRSGKINIKDLDKVKLFYVIFNYIQRTPMGDINSAFKTIEEARQAFVANTNSDGRFDYAKFELYCDINKDEISESSITQFDNVYGSEKADPGLLWELVEKAKGVSVEPKPITQAMLPPAAPAKDPAPITPQLSSLMSAPAPVLTASPGDTKGQKDKEAALEALGKKYRFRNFGWLTLTEWKELCKNKGLDPNEPYVMGVERETTEQDKRNELIIKFLNEIYDPLREAKKKLSKAEYEKEGRYYRWYPGDYRVKGKNANRDPHAIHYRGAAPCGASKMASIQQEMGGIRKLVYNFSDIQNEDVAKQSGFTEKFIQEFRENLQQEEHHSSKAIAFTFAVTDQNFLDKLHDIAQKYFINKELQQTAAAMKAPLSVAKDSAGDTKEQKDKQEVVAQSVDKGAKFKFQDYGWLTLKEWQDTCDVLQLKPNDPKACYPDIEPIEYEQRNDIIIKFLNEVHDPLREGKKKLPKEYADEAGHYRWAKEDWRSKGYMANNDKNAIQYFGASTYYNKIPYVGTPLKMPTIQGEMGGLDHLLHTFDETAKKAGFTNELIKEFIQNLHSEQNWRAHYFHPVAIINHKFLDKLFGVAQTYFLNKELQKLEPKQEPKHAAKP